MEETMTNGSLTARKLDIRLKDVLSWLVILISSPINQTHPRISLLNLDNN